MLRGAADLVDFGELAGDHVGHDVAGVETDPDLKSGIAQVRDAPDQLDGRMAGQRSMVVVSDRCTKYRRHAVAREALGVTLPNRRCMAIGLARRLITGWWLSGRGTVLSGSVTVQQIA